MSTAQVLNALSAAGCPAKQSGDEYSARCPVPAHNDRNPSLSVRDGDKGGTVVTCFAGCVLDDILSAIGLDREAVRPPHQNPEDENIDTYRYTDEKGELLYEVVRRPGKKFLQRRPDLSAESGWTWKLGDVRRPLYRLPKVLQAIAEGETIYVVEGEKDVHALERAGYVATCNSGGAGKWLPEHTASLGAANVIIVADRDTPGRSHSRFVEHALEDVADSVRRVEAAQGKDTYDHLAAGLSVDEFLTVSEDEEAIDLAPELADFLKIHDAYDWLVPGLLEQGERLIITGFEGQGKSELLRQFAVCVAAGVDPLQFHRIEPRRVLFIDCENSDRQTRRRLRPLAELLARSYEPVGSKMMYILTRPKGLDLTREDDAAWLHERMVAHKPELLIIGPLYKLHAQNPNDELAARQVVMALDDAMATAGCALILEAHAGHGDGKGQRNVRPTGSSLWLRWPDFGYGLVPTGVGDDQMEFRRWRGPRGDRKWPKELHRGNSWPWEGKWPEGMPTFGELEPVREELFDDQPF